MIWLFCISNFFDMLFPKYFNMGNSSPYSLGSGCWDSDTLLLFANNINVNLEDEVAFHTKERECSCLDLLLLFQFCIRKRIEISAVWDFRQDQN